jgi:hypothetical protein
VFTVSFSIYKYNIHINTVDSCAHRKESRFYSTYSGVEWSEEEEDNG